MSNRLEMSKSQSILALRERGWSVARIAQELGVHRHTVARYLAQDAEAAQSLDVDHPKCTQVHSGDGEADRPAQSAESPRGSADPKSTEAPPGSADLQSAEEHCGSVDTSSRSTESLSAPIGRSACEALRGPIEQGLKAGFSAKRIHQDLVNDHGFTGSYWSVMRLVRRLGHTRELPFRRMECAAGEEAQIDFGSGAVVLTPEGRRRRTYVFRIVLSHSRKAYSEAVFRQDTESFLRCIENAFWYFGGVTMVLVIDNLRAAVQQADWYEPELHPKLRSFCEHYGCVILPTRPYTPRHKGKIESGVKFVKNNALKGREFQSVEQENDFLRQWEWTVADTRIHGTTKQQVGKLFEEAERGALRPLPVERFPCFQEGKRHVHRDGHIEVDRRYYSVPPEYLHRTVWARWDSRLVRVFNERLEEIAVHVRQQSVGRFSTHQSHIAPEKIHGMERGTEWLLERARRIGTHADSWAQQVIRWRGVHGIRSVLGLVNLVHDHPCQLIDKACEIATGYGAYRLRDVRRLIGQNAARQEQMEFMSEHPIIRNLAVYGDLVRSALRGATPCQPESDIGPCSSGN